MDKINIMDIEPMVFPTKRETRVMIGEKGIVKEKSFAQGFVTILPGGSIPLHSHFNTESYTILSGEGDFSIDGESMHLVKGDFVLIESGKSHGIVNRGEEVLYLMFVYTPGNTVDHWEEELKEDKQ